MNTLSLIVSLTILLSLQSVYANESVVTGLDSTIKKSGVDRNDLGIVVLDAHGKDIYSLNAEKMMIPASLTKIPTAVATLKSFNVTHKFETFFKSKSQVQQSRLSGDLCLVGSGDPTFISERMWFLINELIRTGVKEVDGALLVDDSAFDQERFDSGRDPARVDRAYDAPVGALSFNWNSVNIYVRPGAKVGAQADVIADPENAYIKIEGKVSTTGGSGASLVLDRVERADGDTIRVNGSIGIKQNEVVKYISISKPDLWSGYNALSFLSQRGVKVKGGVKKSDCSGFNVTLAKSPGAPVGQVISDMMKFSNNYIAEMLTKSLAAKKGIRPATMDAGLKAQLEVLSEFGIQTDGIKITSPSGLSQKNKIKPRTLADMLHASQTDMTIFPEFATSFPIAGLDGTLKNRMKNTEGQERVRGKTGLLTGVVGLAGYAGRKDGEIYTYVYLYNGGMDYSKIWSLFDELAVRLVK